MRCLSLPYLPLQQYYSLSVQQDNILVDGRGRPVITGSHSGRSRWWSDQCDLLSEWRGPFTRFKRSYLSTASDIHAFAVLYLQVSRFYVGILFCFLFMLINAKIFTGQWRQWDLVRPQSPSVLLRGLDDAMWSLLCKCWSEKPESRPTISEICDSTPIVKNAMIRALNRIEVDFAIHSSSDSASDKMREFVLTIHRWLIEIDLLSILGFTDLERIFAIILENCSISNLIKLINDEYSPAGRTRLIDLLHEVATYLHKISSCLVPYVYVRRCFSFRTN